MSVVCTSDHVGREYFQGWVRYIATVLHPCSPEPNYRLQHLPIVLVAAFPAVGLLLLVSLFTHRQADVDQQDMNVDGQMSRELVRILILHSHALL
jgi:hypothetical protein